MHCPPAEKLVLLAAPGESQVGAKLPLPLMCVSCRRAKMSFAFWRKP